MQTASVTGMSVSVAVNFDRLDAAPGVVACRDRDDQHHDRPRRGHIHPRRGRSPRTRLGLHPEIDPPSTLAWLNEHGWVGGPGST